MGNYSKNRFRLVTQGITGGKVWYYDDTGAIGTIADQAGFFAEAALMGVDSGDLVILQARDAAKNRQIHMAAFGKIMSDTGSGEVGPQTVVGDTG